jgi:hypothetical protein
MPEMMKAKEHSALNGKIGITDTDTGRDPFIRCFSRKGAKAQRTRSCCS